MVDENGENSSKRISSIIRNKSQFDPVDCLFAINDETTKNRLKNEIYKRKLNINDRLNDKYLNKWSIFDSFLLIHANTYRNDDWLEFLNETNPKTSEKLSDFILQLNQVSASREMIANDIQEISDGCTSTKKAETRENLECLYKRLKQIQQIHENIQRSEIFNGNWNVFVETTARDKVSISVSFAENTRISSIINYKVEWSLCSNFEELEGFMIFSTINSQLMVTNLKPLLKYYIRLCIGTLKGYSQYVLAKPSPIVITGWYDISCCLKETHYAELLRDLQNDFKELHKTCMQEKHSKEADCEHGKRRQVLKHFLSYKSKFTKNHKSGLYLASIIYSDDNVLCTPDHAIPIILIDRETNEISQEDFKWVLKLSACWCSNTFEFYSLSKLSKFRRNFIRTIHQMQFFTGSKDIGRVFYEVISDGASKVSYIVSVRDAKADRFIQNSMSIEQLVKNSAKTHKADWVIVLLKEIKKVIEFHKSITTPLKPGLYLCYLKLFANINSIRIAVPQLHPSVLPFLWMRSNSHVTKEEWEWIHSLNTDDFSQHSPTLMQIKFHGLLMHSIHQLSNKYQIENIENFRIYKLKIFHINANTSFILLVPDVDEVCILSNDMKSVSENEKFMIVSTNSFEISHLYVYNTEFITNYTEMSLIVDYLLSVKENERTKCTKGSTITVHEQLTQFQLRLKEVWNNVCWLKNLALNARKKNSDGLISLKRIIVYKSAYGAQLSTASLQDASSSSSSADQWNTNTLECNRNSEIFNCVKRIYAINRRKEKILFRLQVTSSTKIFDIIEIILKEIKQLNDSELFLNYTNDDLSSYCIIAIIGLRKRVLRNCLEISKLDSSPWSNANFFISSRNHINFIINFNDNHTFV